MHLDRILKQQWLLDWNNFRKNVYALWNSFPEPSALATALLLRTLPLDHHKKYQSSIWIWYFVLPIPNPKSLNWTEFEMCLLATGNIPPIAPASLQDPRPSMNSIEENNSFVEQFYIKVGVVKKVSIGIVWSWIDESRNMVMPGIPLNLDMPGVEVLAVPIVDKNN